MYSCSYGDIWMGSPLLSIVKDFFIYIFGTKLEVNMMYDKLLTISEAAKLLGISPSTLRRLEKDGEVEGYELKVIYTPGGQRRYLMDELQHLYSQTGFSGLVGFGKKPALLIRDCTTAFIDPNSKLSVQTKNHIKLIRKLAEELLKYGFPVFFTATIFEENNAFSRLWGQKFPMIRVLQKDSSWVEIHPSLKNLPFTNVHQTVFISDLWKSPTEQILKEKGVDTLVLAGVTTSGSIATTAIDGIQRGYKVIIPKEVVADRNEAIQTSALTSLNARYADVITFNEVLDYLQQF